MDDATATGKEFDEELKRHSSAGKKRHNHGLAIAICCWVDIAVCRLNSRPGNMFVLISFNLLLFKLLKMAIQTLGADVNIELYRVLLCSMGSIHFWPITIHLQSVVGATIFKWIQ